MKPEDQLLGVCARQNFADEYRDIVLELAASHSLDWSTIYSTALQHGVAPLIFSNLRRCVEHGLDIPAPVMAQFQGCFFYNISEKERRARILAETIDYFRQRSIAVMLIKGAALDVVIYDHPYYVMSEDIDIVLQVSAEELGGEAVKQIRHRLHRLGIEYDFFEHHDITMNGILPIDFQQIWQNARQIEFRGCNVWIMSPEDLFIATCINSCRKRFFKLKSLCDIAEIINRCESLDWHEVVKQAQIYQCSNIVYSALYATKLVVGCDLPEDICDDFRRSRPMRAALLRALVNYLGHHRSLATQFPFKNKNWFSRNINFSLLLPYAAYTWRQMLHKLWLIPQREWGH